jgi:putative transposase
VAGGRWSDGQGTFWGDLVGPNPTDRAKNGVKRSLLVEADGGPLSVVIAGANVPDFKLLEATLDAIVVERPAPTDRAPSHEHLCLDKGYDKASVREIVEERGYIPHIRKIGEEKLDSAGEKRYPARRWVVERTLGWLSKCRAILVRYEKKAANYLGLIKVACILLWYRRQHRLSLLR